MTETSITFEENWPQIARRLARLLAARRVPECQRDDIIQETGVRLFRAWHRLDPDQGAWGLARAIAIHAIADGAITHNRYEVTDLTELPEPLDPERAGIARFRLSSVRRALAQMSPTDRRVLLAEVGAAPPPTLGRSAMKMARSRARQRLRVLVEKRGSWSGLPEISLRVRAEYGRRLFHERAVTYQQFAEGAVATIVAVAITVSGLNSSIEGSGSARLQDTVGGLHALGAAMTGMDLSNVRTARRAFSTPVIRSDALAGREDLAAKAESAEPWWKDPLYARETAQHARHDAEQLQKDTEQARKDAEQIGEDGEQLAEDGKQLAEDLPP